VLGLAPPLACKVAPRLQVFVGEAVFRGLGAVTVKSFKLLSESIQPSPLRMAAVVTLKFGVFAPSKQLALSPYPTKSTMLGSDGQVAAGSWTVVLTRANFPLVADRLGVKVLPLLVTGGAIKSGVGKAAPLAPFEAY
jgi:hypothetical protein